MSTPVEYAIRTLEQELSHFDTVADSAEAIRDGLSQRLAELSNRALEMSNEDLRDPKVVSSAMSIVSASMKALSDREASATRRINAKIKQADNNRADSTSDIVVDLLRKVSSGTLAESPEAETLALDEIDTKLDLIAAANHLNVLDEELRDDPDDISR